MIKEISPDEHKHVKPWYERRSEGDSEDILANLEVIALVQTTDGDDEMPIGVGKEMENDVGLSNDLSADQQQQLRSLLSEYSDVFTDVPKQTNLITHSVKTNTEQSVYKKLHPLKYALCSGVLILRWNFA